MPLPTSAHYAELSGDVQDDVFVLSIPSLGLYFATHAVLSLPGQVEAPITSNPPLPRSQVDLLSGKTSPGGISVAILDKDGRFQAVLSNGLLQRDAELRKGFRRLPFSEYLVRHTGRISASGGERDGLVYKLSISSRLSQLDDRTLFEEVALAAEPCPSPGASKSWTSTDPGTGTSATLTAMDTGDEPDGRFDTFVLTGNPFHIALSILFSGGPEANLYNAWPAWAGCAMTAREVDADKWEEARDLYLNIIEEFTLTGEENAKQFLEKDILRIFCGYLAESGTGRVGCVVPSVPNPTASLVLFDDSVLIGSPLPIEDGSLLITHVQVSMDHDGSEFQTLLPPIPSRPFSEGRYPEEHVWPVEARGLRTELGGLLVAKMLIATGLRRFSVEPRRLAFQCKSRMDLTEAGDHAAIQSKLMPRIDIPAPLGQDAKRYLEVVSVQPGTPVQIEAIDMTSTTINDGFRSAIIAPNDAPDYEDATEEERAYAYLSDVLTEEAPDGRPGYVWT